MRAGGASRQPQHAMHHAAFAAAAAWRPLHDRRAFHVSRRAPGIFDGLKQQVAGGHVCQCAPAVSPSRDCTQWGVDGSLQLLWTMLQRVGRWSSRRGAYCVSVLYVCGVCAVQWDQSKDEFMGKKQTEIFQEQVAFLVKREKYNLCDFHDGLRCACAASSSCDELVFRCTHTHTRTHTHTHTHTNLSLYIYISLFFYLSLSLSLSLSRTHQSLSISLSLYLSLSLSLSLSLPHTHTHTSTLQVQHLRGDARRLLQTADMAALTHDSPSLANAGQGGDRQGGIGGLAQAHSRRQERPRCVKFP